MTRITLLLIALLVPGATILGQGNEPGHQAGHQDSHQKGTAYSRLPKELHLRPAKE